MGENAKEWVTGVNNVLCITGVTTGTQWNIVDGCYLSDCHLSDFDIIQSEWGEC